MHLRGVLKIAGWIGGTAVLIAGIGYGSLQLMQAYFYPSPPAADYPKPHNTLEAQRQDLDYFRKLVALDFAFSPGARAQANKKIDRLEQSPVVLSHAQFRVDAMRVMALADNGHTTTSVASGNPMELPVRVAEFSDGLYVTHATGAHAALLGGRVVAIDGHSIDTVMHDIEAIRGGAPQFRRYYAAFLVTIQDVLSGLGITSATDRSVWTVEKSDGTRTTETLVAYPAPKDEPFAFAERWYSNEPLDGLGKGWKALGPAHGLPISLRDFDKPYRLFWLSGGCTAVIQLKSNTDDGKRKIADFLSGTQSTFEQRKPCNIIFDNRFNGGGDYTKTYSFAHSLIDDVPSPGRIYLLTGPSTFSAGITTTTFIKQSGGDRVSILGEQVGDRLAFFAEGVRACLPNYHLCLYYQRGKHDYQHPCRDPRVCFWLNWYYAPRVKTLDPDETITMSFADWHSGKDPVFDRAVQLAQSDAKP
jgi:hypothetical protein